MRVRKITPNATFQPFPSNGGSFRTEILGKHPKRESYVHPIEEKCPGVPMIPSRANFLVSSPIWEISSSICIYYTYVSVFWPFWPTGHPRICPGIPTTQWGCPLGVTFLIVAQFRNLNFYLYISYIFYCFLTIMTYWATPGMPRHPHHPTGLFGLPILANFGRFSQIPRVRGQIMKFGSGWAKTRGPQAKFRARPWPNPSLILSR